MAGSSHTFHCGTETGGESSSVTRSWLLNGTKLRVEDVHYCDGPEAEFNYCNTRRYGDGRLELSYLRQEKSGAYTCVAENYKRPGFRAEASAYLNVACREFVRYFGKLSNIWAVSARDTLRFFATTARQRQVEVSLGESAKLTCRAKGALNCKT